MSKPKVSIIIPIYNSEKYIKQCLNSITNQTLKDIEVICVNDGSTDGTSEILKEYRKKYKYFKIINQKNQGTVVARKTGLDNATGEYVGFVDNDDFCDEKMYEKMYKKAKSEKLDVVICNYNFYPNDKTNKEKWYKPYRAQKIDYKFIQHNTILWNKIVRRELLTKLDMGNLISKAGEGSYAFVLINAKKIGSIDESLYYYRVGHGSQSSNFKKIGLFESTAKYQEYKLEYAKNRGYSKEWIEYFSYLKIYYSELLMIVAARNNRKDIYNNQKQTINGDKICQKKYQKYLKNDVPAMKRIFINTVVPNSFFLTKLIAKMML